MGLKLSNFGRAKLATPPTGTGGLSFTVESGKGALFPALGAGDYVYLVLKNATKTNNEIVKVEARSGDAFTIAVGGRGADGTTAQTWTANDYVECCLTNAGLLEVFNTGVTVLGTLTPAADKAPYFSGAGSAALFDLSSYMRGSGFLGAGNSAGALSAIGALGLVGGTLTGDVQLLSTDAGAVLGPVLYLNRQSASPTAADEIGSIQMIGRNSAAGSIGYGLLQTSITSAVAGAEQSKIYLRVYSGGAGLSLLSVVGGTSVSNGRVDIGSPSAITGIGEKLVVESGVATSSAGGTHKAILGDFGVGSVLVGAHTSSAVKILTNNSTRIDVHATDGTVNFVGGAGAIRLNGHITRFESAEQAWTNGTSTATVSHGGSRVPDDFEVVFRCKTTEANYLVGDEIVLPFLYVFGTGVLMSWKNATDCGIIIQTGLAFINRVNAAAFTPTAANWALVFRCGWR